MLVWFLEDIGGEGIRELDRGIGIYISFFIG